MNSSFYGYKHESVLLWHMTLWHRDNGKKSETPILYQLHLQLYHLYIVNINPFLSITIAVNIGLS